MLTMRVSICLLIVLCISLIFGTVDAAQRSWIQVHYDPEVSAQTRDHIENAVDVVADMLTEYKLPLMQKITVIVTSDKDSYLKALVAYGQTLEKAKVTAEHTAGISFNAKAVILLKGSPALHASKNEVFRVLPHEVFHQVQSQFGHQITATWMMEASPELFQLLARERVGLEQVQDGINKAATRIFRANSIPSAQQLMDSNYDTFSSLSHQGFPVYEMSLVMLYHLTARDQFEPVLQYYRLLNSGMKPENAFVALFRKPQLVFSMEMDKLFSSLRQNRPQ